MTRIERGAGDLHGRDQIGCTYLDDPLREVTVGHWIGVGRGLPLLRSGGVGGFWIFFNDYPTNESGEIFSPFLLR
jgi:hypothetical protein